MLPGEVIQWMAVLSARPKLRCRLPGQGSSLTAHTFYLPLQDSQWDLRNCSLAVRLTVGKGMAGISWFSVYCLWVTSGFQLTMYGVFPTSLLTWWIIRGSYSRTALADPGRVSGILRLSKISSDTYRLLIDTLVCFRVPPYTPTF